VPAPSTTTGVSRHPSSFVLQEEAGRAGDDVIAGPGAVIGGEEVVADHQAEREHPAGLHLVRVGAENAEQLAQVVHAAVVDAAQALGDRVIASGPVTHDEVDREQAVAGSDDRTHPPDLRPGATALALDLFAEFVGGFPFPGVEHRREQRVPVRKVPVEPALGHAERVRESLDPDGFRATGCEGQRALLDPDARWCARDGGHDRRVSPPVLDRRPAGRGASPGDRRPGQPSNL
jgi:hypothetical protein